MDFEYLALWDGWKWSWFFTKYFKSIFFDCYIFYDCFYKSSPIHISSTYNSLSFQLFLIVPFWYLFVGFEILYQTSYQFEFGHYFKCYLMRKFYWFLQRSHIYFNLWLVFIKYYTTWFSSQNHCSVCAGVLKYIQ